MSFWFKKKNSGKSQEETLGLSSLDKKKKDEKKGPGPKRIDNLRIPQQLPILVRSLGTQNTYVMNTKDLSASGAFVVCSDFQSYPFQAASTILDCIIDLVNPDTQEVVKLKFLGKIARIVATPPPGQPAGFGLRIVQISLDHWQMLEAFIGRHGAAELQQNQPQNLASEAVVTADAGAQTEGAAASENPALHTVLPEAS